MQQPLAPPPRPRAACIELRGVTHTVTHAQQGDAREGVTHTVTHAQQGDAREVQLQMQSINQHVGFFRYY